MIWNAIPGKTKNCDQTSTPPKNTKTSMTLASVKKVPSLWTIMTPFIIIIDFIFILVLVFNHAYVIHMHTQFVIHFSIYFLVVNLLVYF